MIANVPAQWSQRIEFLDDNGVPRLLSTIESSDPSFTSLCHHVDAALDPILVRTVLTDFGSVKSVDNDYLMLISRITLQAHQGKFLTYPVMSDVQQFVETVEYNALDRGENRGLLQARASHGNDFAPGTFDQVHEFIRRKGMCFLEDAEEKMAENALPHKMSGEHYGVGVYVYPVDQRSAVQPQSAQSAPRKAPPRK